METAFITNPKGKRISAVVSMKQYQKFIEALEDLEDIRLYDAAKKSKEVSIPLDKAFQLVEAKRKHKK